MEIDKNKRAYMYSYPHKTAYRNFENELLLSDLWKNEDKNSLFLYMHIAFCESRCAYCNLFSTCLKGKEDLKEAYIKAMKKQAEQIKESLGDFKISSFAIGGGTPTILSLEELKEIFSIAENILKVNLDSVFVCVESSPNTITQEKIDFFKKSSVDRLSIGIQSFNKNELKYLNRFDDLEKIKKSLTLLREANFNILNIDLIYGIPNQTRDNFLYSLKESFKYNPEELYLYPLYIREKTILSKRKEKEVDDKTYKELYETAVEFLNKNGYVQNSKRNFKRKDLSLNKELLEYTCQEDGMISLGCGARSYTKDIHYSEEYAISDFESKNIIENYVKTENFKKVKHGFIMNDDESKRRYLIKSILNYNGLNKADYKTLFNSDSLSDFPLLKELIKDSYAYDNGEDIILTKQGMNLADYIGPMFISKNVDKKMKEYLLK